jgi:hypothetical protein
VVKEQNPVEDAKAATGINVKQMVTIGAITAATGTIVGAVVMELYRYMRPKLPIPQSAIAPQPGAPQGNPALGWPQPQTPWQPHPSGFPPLSAPVPGLPNPAAAPASPQPSAQVPSYQQPPGYQLFAPPQSNPYAPQPALPPADQVAIPNLETSQPEPLSRPELAQWQRGLEAWERRLERRDNEP